MLERCIISFNVLLFEMLGGVTGALTSFANENNSRTVFSRGDQLGCPRKKFSSLNYIEIMGHLRFF